MSIKDYSTTAANNDTAGTVNFAEGQAPSTVNDSMRQVLADIREWYEEAQWINLGHTPVYVSASSFTIATDLTTTYHVGRRVRLTDASTLYGTIASSSYSAPNTAIGVTLDSGSLSASLSAIAMGAVTENSTSLPDKVVTKTGTQTLTNKTINLTSNTLTGTTAQFNTALSDGTFATLEGSETFSGKPTFSGGVEASSLVRISSDAAPPTTGDGLELKYVDATNVAYIQAYDRDAVAYRDIEIDADAISLVPQNNKAVSIGQSATHSAVTATFSALQVGQAGYVMANKTEAGTYYCNNMYYDGAWRAIYNDVSSRVAMNGDGFTFNSAAAVAAGSAVTEVTALLLTPSGNVAVPNIGTDNETANAYVYTSATNSQLRRKTPANVKTELLTPTAVTGFINGQATYIESDVGAKGTGFNVATNIGASWESVGPTGSGATNIYSMMDDIPSTATAVIIKVNCYLEGATSGSAYSMLLYARKTGSATGAGTQTLVARLIHYNRSGLTEADGVVATFTVPVDASRRFDLFFSTGGTSITAECAAYLVGFVAPGF